MYCMCNISVMYDVLHRKENIEANPNKFSSN